MTAPEDAGLTIRIEQSGAPAVVLITGRGYHVYWDSYETGTGTDSLKPIERAVAVARLRALADVLEARGES